jgi:hypothetical protein
MAVSRRAVGRLLRAFSPVRVFHCKVHSAALINAFISLLVKGTMSFSAYLGFSPL